MTQFDDRERAYEAKFALDEELRFKATARRNKLLGLWLAEKFGLSGDDAASYAKEVVISDMEEPGDEDVIRKVLADCEAREVHLSREEIIERLSELMGVAIAQVEAS